MQKPGASSTGCPTATSSASCSRLREPGRPKHGCDVLPKRWRRCERAVSSAQRVKLAASLCSPDRESGGRDPPAHTAIAQISAEQARRVKDVAWVSLLCSREPLPFRRSRVLQLAQHLRRFTSFVNEMATSLSA